MLDNTGLSVSCSCDSSLAFGVLQVQLGMVQFSGHPSLEFPLNMYSDRMAALKAVENLQFMGGGTNTGDALQYVTTNVYNKDGGARTDVSAGLLWCSVHPESADSCLNDRGRGGGGGGGGPCACIHVYAGKIVTCTKSHLALGEPVTVWIVMVE